MNTPQRWITSRKNTAREEIMSPIPSVNTKSIAMSQGRNNIFQVGVIWKKIITAITAMRETPKLTSAKVTFSSGKMILFMRIFLMREEESMIDVMAVEVPSDINAKIVCPRMR